MCLRQQNKRRRVLQLNRQSLIPMRLEEDKEDFCFEADKEKENEAEGEDY